MSALDEAIKQVSKTQVKTTKSPRSPLWKGPCNSSKLGGITFSMLSRFLQCRERFRVTYMEGIKPEPQFNHKIEYGQMWHVCEEALAKGTDPTNKSIWLWEDKLKDYCKDLCKQHPLQQEQIQHWYMVCLTQFPHYVKYWAKHNDVKQRIPLFQEQVFHIPYLLPSGVVVFLRGKWDSVDLIGKQGAVETGVYVQENKTKGDIREGQLQRQLTFDLQTMIYLVALYAYKQASPYGDAATKIIDSHPILGVRYNVVRRPLSGGKGSIVRHKPSKSNPSGESAVDFYKRVGAYIEEEPGHYFMRWKCDVSPSDVVKFCTSCLNPLLQSLCDWYETMIVEGVAGCEKAGLHWRHPFGVQNMIDEGGTHSLDDYLLTGSTLGLTQVDTLFNELT